MTSSALFTDNLPSRMSFEQFVATFGGVYEHSPWVAENTWKNGIDENSDNKDNLITAMRETVDNAGTDAGLLILLAHPELGTNKEAFKALTDASKKEQSSAGLTALADQQIKEMTERNNNYRQRFGFPFIVAVKGLSLADIVQNFNDRINNSKSTEYNLAMEQVHAIARLRICAIT